MKKARFFNIFRTIRETLNRFFAICAIVALGAGFLGGLEATSPDMMNAADSYMDKFSLYDLDVVNRLGFSQEDFDLLKNISGVEQLQKAVVTDEVFLTPQKKRLTLRVFGLLPQDNQLFMNCFELKKGRFPQTEDEAIIQITSIYSSSLPKLGEELAVLDESSNQFKYKTVKIVGIVQGPMFFSAEPEPTTKGSGFLDMALYVRPSFFANQNFNHVYVSVEGAKELDTWSEEYKKTVELCRLNIEKVLKEKALQRFDQILEYSDDAKKIVEKAKEAEQKLNDLDNAEIQKHLAVAAILSQNEKNSNLSRALQSDLLQLKNSERKRIDSTRLNAFIDSVFENLGSYRENIFVVQNRSQNTGYASYKDNIQKISALSKVFPVFFFFIALLVSLTTMTRLIEEKRNEIGTLKSLGFSSLQILGEYILYAFLSSLLGCAVGLAIGFRLFPLAVQLAYSMMYTIPIGKLPFRWNIALPVSAIAIGVILIATVAACFSEVLSRPAVLMQPKAPSPGKKILLEKIGFIWNKLNFSRKVMMRNMFRYKRRLWMTIAGVAGCSSLLVAGFGLRDSLQDIVTIQFDQIENYNLSVLMNNGSAFETDETVKAFFEDSRIVQNFLKVHGESITCSYGEKSLPLTLYVPEKIEQFDNFVNLRERKSHKKIDLDLNDEPYIVITEKQSELLGLKGGEAVQIDFGDGIKISAKFYVPCESYLYSNAYMSPSAYKKLLGKNPEYNAALCKLCPDKNSQETVSQIMESPSVIYAMWLDSLLDNAHRSISSINIVVIVIIITSGLLSLIVLYNLTNINICERKREIATLLVLGYSEKEAKKYIFREINVLSIAGTFAGLFFGGPLHAIVVHVTEVNVVMWGRSVHPLSYVYAFAVSVIFTVFVNLIMKKAITQIDMVESLKSKE